MMSKILESIFAPLFLWLNQMENSIDRLSVMPAKRFTPMNMLRPFYILGPYWMSCIVTVVTCFCFYGIVYVIKNWDDFIIRFKNTIKWF